MSTKSQVGGEVARLPDFVGSVRETAVLARRVQFWEGGRLDVDSRRGRDALSAFLRGLDEMSRALGVTAPPRMYRVALTDRVRATWLDGENLYSLRVMTQSVQGAVYLNSNEYPLSDDAKALSHELNAKMLDVRGVLDRLCDQTADRCEASKAELRVSLAAFDGAWAFFEEHFFSELLDMEADARAVLVETVNLANELDHIASSFGESPDLDALWSDPEFLSKHGLLIEHASRLNSIANPECAGHSFGSEVLEQCEAVVEECLGRGACTTSSPVFAIASRAILAWDTLSCYLHQLTSRGVESLSPHLSDNRELVKELVAWESAWSSAAKYVVDEHCRLALCGIVEYVRDAEEVAPSLTDMLDEQSSELFMVLPRLVWLSFLEDPLAVGALLAPLLPHQFEELRAEEQHGRAHNHNLELVALMDNYRSTWNVLARAAAAAEPRRGDVQAIVQSVFISSVVLGVGSGPLAELVFHGPAGLKAKDVCLQFVHTLEGWSMALQRCCAKEWNSFSAVLMQCIPRPAVEFSAAASR